MSVVACIDCARSILTLCGRLIEPISPTAFFDTHWERQPLAIGRDLPKYYGDLVTVAVVARDSNVIKFATTTISTPAGVCRPITMVSPSLTCVTVSLMVSWAVAGSIAAHNAAPAKIGANHQRNHPKHTPASRGPGRQPH